MIEKDITDAWLKIRETNHTIPDEVLDFMKATAIAALRKEVKPIRFLKSDQKIEVGNTGDFMIEFQQEAW